VGELIDEILKDVRDNLGIMERGGVINGIPSKQYRSDGTPMPPTVRQNWIVVGAGPSELNRKEIVDRLLAVGGTKCDCCGKTREAYGLTHLFSCSRCKKAFYCSAECQRKQWNKKCGHKKYCREPGQVEPGDYVRLNGLQAKPELNGMIVQVVGQVPNNPSRLEVRLSGGNRSLSIPKDKMEQMRPLK